MSIKGAAERYEVAKLLIYNFFCVNSVDSKIILSFVAEKKHDMKSILDIRSYSIDTSSPERAKKSVEDYGYEWKCWYYQKAKRPENAVDKFRFWKEVQGRYIAEVPVAQIVGQAHERYSRNDDMPRWISLLHSMDEKDWRNKDSQEISDVIIQKNAGRSPVYLYRYGDSYFIADGLHRGVFAKFLEMKTMRCEVSDYVFDGLSYSYYLRLTKLVGEKTFEKREKFTGIPEIEFDWHELHFIVGWDEASIKAFECQVCKVKSIMASPMKRKCYGLICKIKYPRCHTKTIVCKDMDGVPDFRAAIFHALTQSEGQALD